MTRIGELWRDHRAVIQVVMLIMILVPFGWFVNLTASKMTMPDVNWWYVVGVVITLIAITLFFKMKGSPKLEEFKTNCKTTFWNNLNAIIFGTIAFVLGLYFLYHGWPQKYEYLKPEFNMWVWALVVACLILWPVEPKKFMKFVGVAYLLILIFHVYGKWDNHRKPQTHIIDIGKNWSKWFVVSKSDSNKWVPDRAVCYAVMSPGGHITTYPAVKSPEIHIPGFPDSLRFRTCTNSNAKIALVVPN